MVNVHIKNNQLRFAFLKEMVIQPSAAIKSLLKQSGLFVGGENPVSKSFSHGYILHMNYLKVKDYFIECGQFIPQLTQGVFLPDFG